RTTATGVPADGSRDQSCRYFSTASARVTTTSPGRAVRSSSIASMRPCNHASAVQGFCKARSLPSWQRTALLVTHDRRARPGWEGLKPRRSREMSIERVLNKESGEGESAPGGQAETLRADRSRSGRLPGVVTEREGLPGAEIVAPFALPLLRILMGVVFIWFGALKVIGESPVSKLVAGTLPWIDPGVVVPALGGLEVLLWIGLILGVGLRLVLPFAAAHLTGTFLTFVMLPGMMFRDDDPLLVTA